jgi:hypothetical protein
MPVGEGGTPSGETLDIVVINEVGTSMPSVLLLMLIRVSTDV